MRVPATGRPGPVCSVHERAAAGHAWQRYGATGAEHGSPGTSQALSAQASACVDQAAQYGAQAGMQ